MSEEKLKKCTEHKQKILQILISFIAISFLVVHLIWPELKVDSITIALFIISIVPWLLPLFKTLEFPGGWKIEFQDVKDAVEKGDKAGLIGANDKNTKSKHIFLEIADRDTNLGLAGLRIEIEKRIIQIAEINNIQNQRRGLTQLLRELNSNGILTSNEYAALVDITTLLNRAIHGESISQDTAKYAIEYGINLLDGLDNKIIRKEGK